MIVKLKYRCTVSYSSTSEETGDFFLGWTPIDDSVAAGNNISVDDSSVSEAFRYQTADELDGTSFWGTEETYTGGGYVANLGLTATNASSVVESLRTNRWIDHYTRAVFVEFNTWNPNTQLFNLFQLCFEFSPMGGIVWSTTVGNVQLYRYTGAAGVMSLVLEALCCACVIVITVMEILKVKKLKRNYFRVFWNIVQLVAILFFVVAVVMYVIRSIWTSRSVEDLMNNPGLCRQISEITI